jgi:hypothetical protein
LGEETVIKFNIAKSHRVPSVYELAAYGLHRHGGRFEKGDSNNNPEEAWELDVMLEKQGVDLLFSVTPFINYFTNYLYLKPTSHLRPEGQVYIYNQTRALLTGAEASVDYQIRDKFRIFINGEYVYAVHLVFREHNRRLTNIMYFVFEKQIKFVAFLFVVFFVGCIEKKDNDEERPVIEILSPLPCDTLYFGADFRYAVKITDNNGLGEISMDVHDNFLHHNHGDHAACVMDKKKEANNPYHQSWLFNLPDNVWEYTFDTLLAIPHKEDAVFFDAGDYHFHIYVTDNEGYQAFTTLDAKVLYN